MTDRQGDSPDLKQLRRRGVLVAGAALLAVAGCATYGPERAGGSGTQPAESSTQPAESSTQPAESGTAPPPVGGSEPSPAPSSGFGTASGGTALGSASDIPVGGGRVFDAQGVVVTQPRAGTFNAFSMICTHQGCSVNEVADGTINCPCHGSKFKITDGSVTEGPATRPLAAKQVSADGGVLRLP
jgi:Rieske Fe-S protein